MGAWVVLWVGLVGLVVTAHVAAAGWPPEMQLAAIAAWPIAGFLAGYAASARGWRRVWRGFAIAAAAALAVIVCTGALLVGDRYAGVFAPVSAAPRARAGALPALPAVWRGARAGAWVAPRAARRWAGRGVLVAVIAAAGWRGYVYLRDLGLVRAGAGDRVAAFDRLVATLGSQYSHWQYAPVTAAELAARWRPRVVAASASCPDPDAPCLPYLAAVRDALAELGDSHTGLVDPHLVELARPAIDTARVEGALVVTRVVPGSDAAQAGLVPGAAIGAIDGAPVGDALAAVPAWRVAHSSVAAIDYARAAEVLVGPSGTTVAIDVAPSRGAAPLRAVLRRERRSPPRPVVESRFAAPGVLVVEVRGLDRASSVDDFDRAIDQPGVRAIVVDLRGNYGGNSGYGGAMAGRLTGAPLPSIIECFPNPHPLRMWLVRCFDNPVPPRGRTFTGPVAVLLDTGVLSSGEWLAAALCESGRARCFGRRTGGGSGNPLPFAIPGGTVRYSTGLTRRLDGSSVERDGIPPHEVIEWHRADLESGRDPDLDAALRYLAGQP